MLLLAAALAAVLVVPALFRDGMFADGILYAAVSKNLSEGLGTFWHPHFSELADTHFHEQPPLVFFLQSLFFRVFEGIYPERVFDLVFVFLNGWLIVRLWRRIFRNNPEARRADAFALILFFISPVVFYAFVNNLIEITMSVFVLACIEAQHAVLVEKRKPLLNSALAFVWLLAASFCKGPQGLFPLVFPAMLFVFRFVSFKNAAKTTAVLFIPLLAVYALLLLLPGTSETFTSWYENRIVQTFGGTHDTSGSHFHLLFELLLDILPWLGLGLVLLLAGRTAVWDKQTIKWGNVFLLLALAGSLPLLITREQRGFYLVTAMPFFAMAFAAWLYPFYLRVTDFIFRKTMARNVAVVIFVAAIAGSGIEAYLKTGTPKRDEKLLHDIYLTGKIVGEKGSIVIDETLYKNWSVANYYQRYFHISVSTNPASKNADYWIKTTPESPGENWEKQEAGTQEVYFFKKK
ncbi:MAG TPA: hypothetical protein VI731_11105 [Bacteroidia bacterium]|nr:hypothetical protein [Bacteroidia bacterium]